MLKGGHKDGHSCVKKYEYWRAYERVKRDYRGWVESKFCFEK